MATDTSEQGRRNGCVIGYDKRTRGARDILQKRDTLIPTLAILSDPVTLEVR